MAVAHFFILFFLAIPIVQPSSEHLSGPKVLKAVINLKVKNVLNEQATCYNGLKINETFKLGVIGSAAYDFLVNNPAEVQKRMAAYRVRKEQEGGKNSGLSIAWFLIVCTCVPFALVWLMAAVALYAEVKETDKYLMLDQQYKKQKKKN